MPSAIRSLCPPSPRGAASRTPPAPGPPRRRPSPPSGRPARRAAVSGLRVSRAASVSRLRDEARKGNVMRIFLAGATGALGTRLVPKLVEHGHTVVGTTRSQAKTAAVSDLGASPVVVDALNRDAVIAAVSAARPDAVVHQLTALAGADFRRFERSFALTNRLR